MIGFGGHDHIIDAIVGLQDRLERLKNAVQQLFATTLARVAELEERLARIEGVDADTDRE
jgi:hypothetical protein